MFSSKRKSPYDHDIIIDFLLEDGNFSRPVRDFSEKYIVPMTLISSEEFFEQTAKVDFESPFKDSGKKIRIYLIAHCKPGAKFLGNCLYSKLADHLAKYIGNKDNEVVINLAACSAGEGINDNLYYAFAARLHRELFEKCGRDIPVVARKLVTLILAKEFIKYSDGVKKNEFHKTTYHHKFTLEEINILTDSIRNVPVGSLDYKILELQIFSMQVWQQPGSKIIFKMSHDKKQMCQDAYCLQFKSKALRTVQETLTHTRRTDKKNLLTQWQNSFFQLSDENISVAIEKELNIPNSVIKKHSNPLSYFNDANAYSKFKTLLEKRKEFLSHAHPTIEVRK